MNKHKQLQLNIRCFEEELRKLLSATEINFHKVGLCYHSKITLEKGLSNIIQPEDFTRVSNSSNGNPRYVLHYLKLAKGTGKFSGSYEYPQTYEETLSSVKKHFHCKKFHNKQYGGGILFESYNLDDTSERLNNYMESEI